MKKEIEEIIIPQLEKVNEVGDINDGYHTFNELYHYRALYNAMVVSAMPKLCVKSKRHSNGEKCFGGGWFVVVMQLPTGQVTNHYEGRYWNMFHCKEVEKAPEWDGHTPQEAARRMEQYLSNLYSPEEALSKLKNLNCKDIYSL